MPAHENRVKSTTPVGLRVTKRDRGVWAPAAGRVCDGGGFVLPTIAGGDIAFKGKEVSGLCLQTKKHAPTHEKEARYVPD
jgi:hypothetical protein